MTKNRATMTDVARRAGVSVMTVSRAFNQPHRVSAEILRRVEQAASDASYVPDRIAGALKSRTFNLVAAIVPSLVNSLFATTLRGLSQRLNEAGLVLTVAEAEYDEQRETKLVRELLSLRPAALVFHETTHSEETRRLVARSGVVTIETGDLVNDPLDGVVSFSNHAGAALLARHLLDAGRRRIAFVTLPLARSRRARERWSGFTETLAAAGLAIDGCLIEIDGGYHGAAAVVDRLLAARPRFEAVFGAGDVFAAGLAIALLGRGITVPGDLAVASFDHHDIIDIMNPPLTHLRIPRERIGQLAADLIVARRRGEDRPARIDVGFDLVPRQSTAKP